VKVAVLVFYILSTLFVNSFVIIFVITVLLATIDFWVMKNVSGRILVGLRWWNKINDEGERLRAADSDGWFRLVRFCCCSAAWAGLAFHPAASGCWFSTDTRNS
jgi:hypothetical protein